MQCTAETDHDRITPKKVGVEKKTFSCAKIDQKMCDRGRFQTRCIVRFVPGAIRRGKSILIVHVEPQHAV